jgi:hypothetical protein
MSVTIMNMMTFAATEPTKRIVMRIVKILRPRPRRGAGAGAGVSGGGLLMGVLRKVE